MSATASLGTVLLWDVEGGLPQVGGWAGCVGGVLVGFGGLG